MQLPASPKASPASASFPSWLTPLSWSQVAVPQTLTGPLSLAPDPPSAAGVNQWPEDFAVLYFAKPVCCAGAPKRAGTLLEVGTLAGEQK